MNNLERNYEQVVGQDIVNFETAPEPANEKPKLVTGILRRWYIVFVIFFVVCGLGLPAIWLLIDSVHHVTGAIRIAPIMADILAKDKGDISNYEVFMNTQAEMITSDQVLQRVADDLQDKNLSFFENEAVSPMQKLKQRLKGMEVKPDLVWLLKQAIASQTILIRADPTTELIKIKVKSLHSSEAIQIVDAFINNAMAVGQTTSSQDEDLNLSLLEAEKRAVESEIDYQRQTIHRLAEQYGTDTLSGRQEMAIQRIVALQAELIKTEANRVALEAEVKLLERTKESPIPSDELLKMRQEYINKDPSVIAFANDIALLERDLIISDHTLTSINADLKLKSILLDAMKARLPEIKEQASADFDKLLTEQIRTAGESDLIRARTKLEHTIENEKLLRETIEKEDAETIKLGQMQLQIEDAQDKLEISKQRYEAVLQRIQDLELQRKRPARMSVHYYAQTLFVEDERIKYSAAIVFLGLVIGLWLAYIRDKADLRLRTPEDVAKRTGIRIIGTTTSLNNVKPSFLPQQIICDYQTIRANLGLLDGEGIPKKLVVTSPGMKEGKTTFVINLATSMAEAGKKVLLIDGDLRKPDIARLLNLPKESRGLQDVLCGIKLERAVYSIPSTGLDVLAADFRDAVDAYELLALPSTAKYISEVSKQYDHVIIDTPPVLAFPDALIWAKIGDAVILTSFTGHTTLPDLRESKERLMQINARVLGTVVSSVDVEHSYYRQDYSYYAQSAKARLRRKSI